MDKFSVEEINLMCIYDTSSRTALLADLLTGIGDVAEPEMRDIFESATAKLENMDDTEFNDIGFYIADDSIDDGEV